MMTNCVVMINRTRSSSSATAEEKRRLLQKVSKTILQRGAKRLTVKSEDESCQSLCFSLYIVKYVLKVSRQVCECLCCNYIQSIGQ